MPGLLLRAALEADQDFALHLLRANMLSCYQRHGLTLDERYYRQRWLSLEHRIAELDGERVGLVSLSRDPMALHLRELQIREPFRNGGLGSCLIDRLQIEAHQAGKAFLRLRVFNDSAAQRLYRRKGFVVYGEEGMLLKMQCPLPAPASLRLVAEHRPELSGSGQYPVQGLQSA